MTISKKNCAYNNQTHCNIKNLYSNKHKHKHMVNHICWNPSFFPLPNADIHEISNFYQKRHLFIKNYSFFIKNLIDPPYKKLQPQISPFIKNSIFGNNRDPCFTLSQLSHFKNCSLAAVRPRLLLPHSMPLLFSIRVLRCSFITFIPKNMSPTSETAKLW